MKALCDLSKTYAPLAGRILLAFIFLQSGYDKVMNYDKVVRLMAAKGIPMPEVLLAPSIVILLASGIMLLVGWKARWAALALIVFMIPATLYFHNYWVYPDAQQLNQFHHFVKNLAIIGALLLVLGMGSGALSADGNKEA